MVNFSLGIPDRPNAERRVIGPQSDSAFTASPAGVLPHAGAVGVANHKHASHRPALSWPTLAKDGQTAELGLRTHRRNRWRLSAASRESRKGVGTVLSRPQRLTVRVDSVGTDRHRLRRACVANVDSENKFVAFSVPVRKGCRRALPRRTPAPLPARAPAADQARSR